MQLKFGKPACSYDAVHAFALFSVNGIIKWLFSSYQDLYTQYSCKSFHSTKRHFDLQNKKHFAVLIREKTVMLINKDFYSEEQCVRYFGFLCSFLSAMVQTCRGKHCFCH